ncbi:MAG: NAD(P)H nitroreductase, partial [Bacteroidaceae bacterium]|nr:NAD(P)H nitroreductase [Bacteroidaceae bacterium]
IQVRERTMPDGSQAEDVVRRILQLPANLRVLSIIALGNKGMERKPFNEERLLWDKVSQWK